MQYKQDLKLQEKRVGFCNQNQGANNFFPEFFHI